MKAEEAEEIRRALLLAAAARPPAAKSVEAPSAPQAVGKCREALGRKSSSQESLTLPSHSLSL